jgi:hypothetical protein
VCLFRHVGNIDILLQLRRAAIGRAKLQDFVTSGSTFCPEFGISHLTLVGFDATVNLDLSVEFVDNRIPICGRSSSISTFTIPPAAAVPQLASGSGGARGYQYEAMGKWVGLPMQESRRDASMKPQRR